MSRKTLRDVLNESKEGRKILKKYQNNLDDYEKSENENTVNNNAKNTEISKRISKLMMKDPRVNHALKEQLPSAHGLKQDKLRSLRSKAKDGSRKEKKAAQKELDKIRDAREKNVHSEYKSVSSVSYSKGREGYKERDESKNQLTTMVFNKLIGTEENRTWDVQVPEGGSPIDYTYNLKNGNKAHLRGYKFEPAQNKNNGKVVIFYGGSGLSAVGYVENIKKVYTDAGCTVVVMDYRGFGKSKTEDSTGQEVDFPLGERSMYEDGKAMLSYVQKTLGYSNNKIILHGYSLGGAVASKVAANLAEENAVKRKDGKLTKEKQRLGGLVLQSPIGSNYRVSKDFCSDNSKTVGILAAFYSWMVAGAYNTISHMKRLHKYDPKLPVHLVSGSFQEDHLNIEKSGILANNPYSTATTYTTDYGHTCDNIEKKDTGLQNLIKRDREKEYL